MARITQEDCLPLVENRFDLVLKAAARARDLQLDKSDPIVSAERDKPTVVALREIATGVDLTQIKSRAEQMEEADMDAIDQQLKEQLAEEMTVDTELLAAFHDEIADEEPVSSAADSADASDSEDAAEKSDSDEQEK